MRASAKGVLTLAAVAAIAAIAWFLSRETDHPQTSLGSALDKITPNANSPRMIDHSDVIAPSRRSGSKRSVAYAGIADPLQDAGKSHLADDLHSPLRTGIHDLSVVMNLFSEYRKRFRGFPSGEDNAAFVRALCGNNPERVALLNRDHPAIDAQGQLLDRWGKPFFFHLMGSDAVEIRSAGADRQLYTSDDLLTDSAGAKDVAAVIAD